MKRSYESDTSTLKDYCAIYDVNACLASYKALYLNYEAGGTTSTYKSAQYVL